MGLRQYFFIRSFNESVLKASLKLAGQCLVLASGYPKVQTISFTFLMSLKRNVSLRHYREADHLTKAYKEKCICGNIFSFGQLTEERLKYLDLFCK